MTFHFDRFRAFSRGVSYLCWLLPAVVLTGCSSSELERVPVSGNVTLQGEPVANGQIRFSPTGDTKVPAVIESIREGRYATEKSGGVPVGRYRVEIRAYDPDAPPRESPMDPPPPQILPAKWNTRSTLEFVVESGQGSITKDYDLTP